jgi:hypothetical protein
MDGTLGHRQNGRDAPAISQVRSSATGAREKDYTVGLTMSRLLVVACAALGLAAVVASGAEQFRSRGRWGVPLRTPTADSFDGSFNFCRVLYRGNRFGDGGGWGVDYPRADINLSVRLSELTRARISRDAAGEPNHLVVRLTDEALFQCPFVMMTEVGAAYLDDDEASRLRTYLLKGGFLWADDFWGSYAWENWHAQIRKVLPANEYPIVDLPLDHPLFRTQFEITRVPQIPSINFWMGSGGGTSERGGDSAQPHARAILDRAGNIVVLMTHNTDIGDSWEREADDPEYFFHFAVDGYALGINVVLYAMTH